MTDGFAASLRSDPGPVECRPSDRNSVVEFVRKLLKRSLYEDCDFEVTDKYISIDLRYDSRSYVDFYQGQVSKAYPDNAKIEGTRITVYFGERCL